MKEAAGRNKTNSGATEINLGDVGHIMENGRVEKTRIGKIKNIFQGAAREICIAIKARFREGNTP